MRTSTPPPRLLLHCPSTTSTFPRSLLVEPPLSSGFPKRCFDQNTERRRVADVGAEVVQSDGARHGHGAAPNWTHKTPKNPFKP